MGAGISVASDTASAITDADESVVNKTNVFYNQDQTSNQSVIFNNCSVYAKDNVNIDIDSNMHAAMKQMANTKDPTDISSQVAQTMQQKATSSLGVGTLGYSGAVTKAAAYANIVEAVGNYIVNSAKQQQKQAQTFSCSDSTIVAGGSFNLSELSTGSTTGSQSSTVVNSTTLKNSVDQTIAQSASATSGLTGFGVIGVLIVIAVGCVAVKLIESKSKNESALRNKCCNGEGPCTECATQGEQNNSNSQNNNQNNSQNNSQKNDGECSNVDCGLIQPHHNSHIHSGYLIFYFVVLIILGVLIGVWFIMRQLAPCLDDAICTSKGNVSWRSGCSCNRNQIDQSNVCPFPSSIDGTMSMDMVGYPLKYQYPLTVSDIVSCSAPSMQNILVQYFNPSSSTGTTVSYNSNNGRNLATYNSYVQAYDDTPVIQDVFIAAADYIQKNNSMGDFDNLILMMGKEQGLQAKNLYLALNPLDILVLYAYSGEDVPYATTYANYDAVKTQTYVGLPRIPLAFRWSNKYVGNCSVMSTNYKFHTGSSAPTPDVDPVMCGSMDAASYTSTILQNQNLDSDKCGSALYLYMDVTINTDKNQDPGEQAYMWLDNSDFTLTPTHDEYTNGGVTVSTSDVYAQYKDLSFLKNAEIPMVRFLYTAILARFPKTGLNDSIWGLNAYLDYSSSSVGTQDYCMAKDQILSSSEASGTAGSSLTQFLIRITPSTSSGSNLYSPSTGLKQTSISTLNVLNQQGVTAKSDSMGYCKTAFLNKYVLYGLFALAGFWLIFGGIFLTARYINHKNANSNANNTNNNANSNANNTNSTISKSTA